MLQRSFLFFCQSDYSTASYSKKGTSFGRPYFLALRKYLRLVTRKRAYCAKLLRVNVAHDDQRVRQHILT
jgi:hypothetical protein